MEGGIIVPRAYILPRGASPLVVQAALMGLAITPISCAIISIPGDSQLAHEFSSTVVRTATEQDALEFSFLAFAQTQMPSLIIAKSPGIMALHEDGCLEEMNWPVPASTIN